MQYLSLIGVFGCLLLAAAPGSRRVQDRGERAFLHALLTQLKHTTTTAGLASVRCTGQTDEPLRLCNALIAERRSELTGQTGDALGAERELERAVTSRPSISVAWFGLGLVRLQLARDTVFARGGTLMPVGTSYVSGAANAFTEALRLDSTFVMAIEALANVPRPREGWGMLKSGLEMLRRLRPILSAQAMASAAKIERDAGSVDSAIALEERALASGQVDSGLVSLGLARDLYRVKRPVEGRMVLLRGAGTATSVAKQAYRDELVFVATPSELAAWDSLPPNRRSAWLAAFWQNRDIAEGRKEGARLIEHYARVEYALKAYAISIPQTGRQKFHTVSMDMQSEGEMQAEKFAVYYATCFPDFVRLLDDARTIGHDTPFDYYRPVQDLVDDRGAIWIRHGQPTEMVASHSGEAAEVWRYDRPTGPLVLQFRGSDFQGSPGASTLVPTILAMSPTVRDQVCNLEMSLCTAGITRIGPLQIPGDAAYKPKLCNVTFTGLNAGLAHLAEIRDGEVKAEGQRVNTAAINRGREVGRESIDLATTTDSYDRLFEKALHPLVVVYGLDRAAGGAPRAVVAFALPGEELGHSERDAATGRIAYPVSIQVIAARIADGSRVDTDTLRQFATMQPLAKGQFITGMSELPLPPGHYTISVVFTQTDGHGAIAHLLEMVVPGGGTRLAVSDLVLGRDSSGVRWNSGATSVGLNPLNTYPKGGAAQAYFQLSGLTPGRTYQTRFEFFRSDDEARRAPRLVVSDAQVARTERMEVSRLVGLQNLDAGKYRVKVTISGGGAETSATAWMVVLK